jgi:hypothetical protein
MLAMRWSWASCLRSSATGWASDPNRLDASLYEFVGVPDYVGRVRTAEELRAEVSRFAGMLLGYAGKR